MGNIIERAFPSVITGIMLGLMVLIVFAATALQACEEADRAWVVADTAIRDVSKTLAAHRGRYNTEIRDFEVAIYNRMKQQ